MEEWMKPVGLALQGRDRTACESQTQQMKLEWPRMALQTSEHSESLKLNVSRDLNLGSTVRSTVPSVSPTEFGEFSPNSATKSGPSQNLQQVFEHALIREEEDRATHLHFNASPFKCHQEQVQVPSSNPKILYNVNGNPYVEGDPNFGYTVEDTLPRAGNRATDISSSSLSVIEESNGIPRELAEVSVVKGVVIAMHLLCDSEGLLCCPVPASCNCSLHYLTAPATAASVMLFGSCHPSILLL
ncbi:hypothetical protein RHMOL_Rhmol02G0155800 [Rhododendron molle]|uniref:Uncharacterized protein n=1 Tax=Rhododendron molle TaxID=49168 RepID=A0ACC0PQL4_RHOML|nr:hypothetical protein RHMOL_Rhmol02G0155800 [Rhododendron molle]